MPDFSWLDQPSLVQFTSNLPIGNLGQFLGLLVESFWSEDVWLPSNITWDDIASGPDKAAKNTDYAHVWFTIVFALGFILLKYAVHEVILAPLGAYLGFQRVRYYYKPLHDDELEAAYQRRIQPTEFSNLAKQINSSVQNVEWWLRRRRDYDTPSPLMVFCDAAWKSILFFSNFIFGLHVLWDKAWLWDIDQCYVGYPHHRVTTDVWWYYTISSAIYCSLMLSKFWLLMISQFRDVPALGLRKNLWQMFVHHIATIALLSFSWVCNLHRIGTLVLLCHDFSNIFVELAKAAKYAKYQKLYYALSLMLIVTWISTRIGIYPFYIIWSTSVRAPQLLPMFPAYYIFNALLCLLLVLHVVWTWHYINTLFSAIRKIQTQIEDDYIRKMNRIKEKPSKHDSSRTTAGTIWDGLNLQADVNEHVDRAISQLVSFVNTYRSDRMDLPNVEEGSEFRLKIHEGYMSGLANMARSGDQHIKYFDNKLSVQLQFQFSKLKIVYKYLVQAYHFGTTGEIEGSLDRFTIVFDLLIDFENEKPLLLKEFTITDISDLRVELTGNFLLDRFVNPITQLFTSIFHKTIIEVVQSNIGSAIQDAFNFANTNKSDIIQSIMLYTVFEYKQVTDIIVDRYIEWRNPKNPRMSQKTHTNNENIASLELLSTSKQSFSKEAVDLLLK